ncbi:MAG TPA: hypothetical protein VEX40_03925, partial [Mycobacterium sp.]|nr:hypothetical protein [Mycobacterium sp.]
MDAVLGLSVTPSAVGLVLVEGQDADGATTDGEAFEVRSRGWSIAQTSEQAAAAVLRTEAIAADRGHRVHSIGVTWSDDADTEASLLLKSLSDSGFDNIVRVRLSEATDALARGIAEVTGYSTTAVCVIEPEQLIALVVQTDHGAVQTAVNHSVVTEEDLIGWLSAVFTKADWQPEALVLVGSAEDLDCSRSSRRHCRCRCSHLRRRSWRWPAARLWHAPVTANSATSGTPSGIPTPPNRL